MPRAVRRFTDLDAAALALIQRCGFVRIDATGEPGLESNTQLGRWRVQRLIAHDAIVPSGDALPLGGVSQTYRPREL